MSDPIQAPAPFRLVFEYFWVVGLALMVVNYVKARRGLNAATLSPDRLADGQRYLRIFVVMSAIPLAIMGLGQQLGQTPTVLHYFRPQDKNPFVLAWFAVIFLQACVQAWWVLLADGAAKSEAVGLWSVLNVPPRFAKLMAAFGPFFILLWAGLVSMMDVPVSP